MKKKLYAFNVNTIQQAEEVIFETKIYKIKPIIYLKNYFIKGFGADFISTFQDILVSKFGRSSFELFVDCGFDNSLSINMIMKKINYIKLKGNSIILSKIQNIADKNKVLLNPSFNVVDCTIRKNINSKLHKIYSKDKR